MILFLFGVFDLNFLNFIFLPPYCLLNLISIEEIRNALIKNCILQKMGSQKYIGMLSSYGPYKSSVMTPPQYAVSFKSTVFFLISC